MSIRSLGVFFFFSSRRRHTRFDCDWSSDVCSSDLAQRAELRDVRIDNGEKGGELKVRVDRERAAAFGFNAEQVASFVGLALRGAPMREFRRGDNEVRSEEHTSELQSQSNLVCRLLLE